jgi:Mg2+/Co2+ transporter CorB
LSQIQIGIFTVLLLILILLAAFFALAETSIMAANRYRLRYQARLKKLYAIRILQLLKRPDRLLGAILIGSTSANILASSLATLIAFHFLGDKGALLVVILLTFIILIFAEITPKTLAAIYPDKVLYWIAYPIQFVLKLLYPVVWIANTLSNSFLRLFRINIAEKILKPLSREELRSVVYDTKGKISRQYQNMLLGILDLNKLTVDDVMIPQHEIQGVDIAESWEKMIIEMRAAHEEAIPIFRENINKIVGVVFIKELLFACLTYKEMNKILLQQFLREPYFVPLGTPLNIQLRYFQQTHERLAFVVDEYGDIQGLLTLDHILEEIVGDFTLRVTSIKLIEEQSDHSYLVDGAVTIREFNRISQWQLPLRGPKTINGLVVEYLEALPRSSTAVLIAGHPIEIILVKDNRVKCARIFPRLANQSLKSGGAAH